MFVSTQNKRVEFKYNSTPFPQLAPTCIDPCIWTDVYKDIHTYKNIKIQHEIE